MYRYLACCCGSFLLSLSAALAFGKIGLLALFPLCAAALLWRRHGLQLLRCLLCGLLAAVAVFFIWEARMEEKTQLVGQTVPVEGYVLSANGASSRSCTIYARLCGKWQVLSLTNYLEGEDAAQPGDRVAGEVLLTRVDTESDTLLLSGGVQLCGTLKTIRESSPLQPGILYRMIVLRQQILRQLAALRSDTDATLAAGMLTGELSGLPAKIRMQFSAAGISHILAVSGLHLSILTAVIARLCDLLYCSRRTRTVLCMGCCLIMLVLAGFSVSVLRAALMTGFLLLARGYGRTGDGLTSLAVSAALLAALNPAVLCDLSYLLTCTATLGILLLSTPLLSLFPLRKSGRGGRLLRIVEDCIAVSLAAQIGTLPIIALQFGSLPTYSLLCNILIVPLVYGVLLLDLAAVLFVILGLSGGFTFGAAAALAGVIRRAAALIAKLPFATLSVFCWWQFIPVLSGLLLLLLLLRASRKRRLAITAAGCLAMAIFLWATAPLSEAVLLAVDGNTGALLIRQDNEAALLEATETPYEATQLARLLQQSGSPRLRCVYRPAAFHDLSQELRLCRLLEPNIFFSSEETGVLGQDQIPEETLLLSNSNTICTMLSDITAFCPDSRVTLLQCGTQKVLKCWAGYDIITAEDIPEEVAVVIDRAGNVWCRDSSLPIYRWNGVTIILF